jgi:CRISPR-associated protein Csx3
MKVVLCGPPQSGKSCLREGLKQAIARIEGAPYPYVITACPDGEGAWFSEAAQRNPELARTLKQTYKARFTWEFARVAAQWVRDASLPFNIIDMGGKIDDKNRLIASGATHAVILFGDTNKVPAWQEFCSELNLKVVALIHSNLEGVADEIEFEVPILKGSVHRLERGQDVSNRPMVQALARLLVRMSNLQG